MDSGLYNNETIGFYSVESGQTRLSIVNRGLMALEALMERAIPMGYDKPAMTRIVERQLTGLHLCLDLLLLAELRLTRP